MFEKGSVARGIYNLAFILFGFSFVIYLLYLILTGWTMTGVPHGMKAQVEKQCLDAGYTDAIIHTVRKKGKVDISVYCHKQGSYGEDVIVPLDSIE